MGKVIVSATKLKKRVKKRRKMTDVSRGNSSMLNSLLSDGGRSAHSNVRSQRTSKSKTTSSRKGKSSNKSSATPKNKRRLRKINTIEDDGQDGDYIQSSPDDSDHDDHYN